MIKGDGKYIKVQKKSERYKGTESIITLSESIKRAIVVIILIQLALLNIKCCHVIQVFMTVDYVMYKRLVLCFIYCWSNVKKSAII